MLFVRFAEALAILTVTLLIAITPAMSQQETVLHSFDNNGSDGVNPYAGLIFDAAGNLYGTTYNGGAYGNGTVFELTPKADGTWTEKILHSFVDNGKDGLQPYAGLTLDSAGNLYGTTSQGGAYGAGTVFELTRKPGGAWAEKILHNFSDDGKDGFQPYAAPIFDAAGNLYGTTRDGGLYGVGTVFELSPKAGGGWSEKILHDFTTTRGRGDGNNPEGSLILDTNGNLYGTTTGGGADTWGMVFELIPSASGPWTETVLHNFTKDGTDGTTAWGGLTFDSIGNLYGVTAFGGAYSNGTVFELTPAASGIWTETILLDFNGADGYFPVGNLIFDAAGNLYGTTDAGGAYSQGTAFELMPAANGNWTQTVLYNFSQDHGQYAYEPTAGLILDPAGNLYGTTYYGGLYVGGYVGGTVFKITP